MESSDKERGDVDRPANWFRSEARLFASGEEFVEVVVERARGHRSHLPSVAVHGRTEQ
jgi:hypothetical protein